MQQVSTQIVLGSLFPAELYLLIARLVLASTLHHVFERNFLAVRSPSMREYSVARDFTIVLFHQIQIPMSIIFNETHRCADLWQGLNGYRGGYAGTKPLVSSWRSGSREMVVDGTVKSVAVRNLTLNCVSSEATVHIIEDACCKWDLMAQSPREARRTTIHCASRNAAEGALAANPHDCRLHD